MWTAQEIVVIPGQHTSAAQRRYYTTDTPVKGIASLERVVYPATSTLYSPRPYYTLLLGIDSGGHIASQHSRFRAIVGHGGKVRGRKQRQDWGGVNRHERAIVACRVCCLTHTDNRPCAELLTTGPPNRSTIGVGGNS